MKSIPSLSLKKQILLLKTLKIKEMRTLPLGVLFSLRNFLKNEKLIQIDDKIVINSFLPPFPSEAFRMLALSIKSLLKGKAAPISTYISVTNKCRFNCWHCSKAYRNGKNMPLNVILNTLKELQDMGICIIGFTGGEPLLREDLEQMVNAIDERSVSILFTTGDGLTEDRAKKLKELGLFGIAISLDHFKPKVHDRLRRYNGAFDIAIKAVNISIRNGFYTMLQLVATKHLINKGEIWDYLNFAKNLGVHEIRIMEPMPTGYLIKDNQDCFLNEQERNELKKVHIEANKTSKYPSISSFAYIEDKDLYGCGAGFQHLYIDAEGNVCPCDFTPLSFGNVQKEGLAIAWQRLNNSFKRPRSNCFLWKNKDEIKKRFKDKLPLNYEDSLAICQHCQPEELPKYYKKLGWR
jgi:MoaA/NifB/PqqE/SkfB family radical SAM enzyme